MHLVRAGNDYVLLGSAEHGVVPIHRYTEEEARDAGLLLATAPPERSRLAAAGRSPVGTGRAAAAALGQTRPSPRDPRAAAEDPRPRPRLARPDAHALAVLGR